MKAVFKKFLTKKKQPKGFFRNLGEIILAVLIALLIRSLFFNLSKFPPNPFIQQCS
jgi:hypothetical protein